MNGNEGGVVIEEQNMMSSVWTLRIVLQKAVPKNITDSRQS